MSEIQKLLKQLAEEKGDSTLASLLSKHFSDDERDFKEIKSRLEKREEIAVIKIGRAHV